jgi:phage tail tube protein FII
MKHNIIHEETWPIIDQFFQEMPEAIEKLPTFQDALAESQRQGEKQMLVRQLRHKFSRIPKGIVQQIEATTDKEQLDNWSVQIISAKKLTEIDFNFPQKT